MSRDPKGFWKYFIDVLMPNYLFPIVLMLISVWLSINLAPKLSTPAPNGPQAAPSNTQTTSLPKTESIDSDSDSGIRDDLSNAETAD